MSPLVKNIFHYSGAVVIQKVIAFFYFSIIARSLGPELSGSFFLGLSLAQIFSTFADLGVANFLIRETSQNKEATQSRFADFLGLRLVVNVLAYGGVVISAGILGYPKFIVFVALLSGISMLLDSFSTLFYAVVRGHQDLKIESRSMLAFQTIQLVLGALVLSFTKNIVLFACVLIVSSTVHFLISRYALRTRTEFHIAFRFQWNDMKAILVHSIPFAFIAIFSRLYTQADIIMLSKINCSVFNCAESVGLYSVGVKSTLALQSIPLSFMAAIYPAMSEYVVGNRGKLKHIFLSTLRFLGVFAAAAFLAFQAMGETLVPFMWGEGFLPTVHVLSILLLGSFFVALSFPCGSFMNASKQQGRYAVYVLIALIVNILLNVPFIYHWSYMGSAWASIIGSVVLCALALGRIVKTSEITLKESIGTFGGTLCAGAAAFGVLVVFPHAHFLIRGALSLTVFGILLIVFRIVTRDDIRYLLSVVKPSRETTVL